MRHIETTLLFVFLGLTIATGLKVLHDINSADIKGQVKAIVYYNHGIKQ